MTLKPLLGTICYGLGKSAGETAPSGDTAKKMTDLKTDPALSEDLHGSWHRHMKNSYKDEFQAKDIRRWRRNDRGYLRRTMLRRKANGETRSSQ